jgi:hypothetical protein
MLSIDVFNEDRKPLSKSSLTIIQTILGEVSLSVLILDLYNWIFQYVYIYNEDLILFFLRITSVLLEC